MEIESFCPGSREAWRKWLSENHNLKQSVWLVYFKKKPDVQSLTYSEAVDEALCFGWIDSTRKTLDADRFTQFFCRRKPASGWSRVNKEKITRLIGDRLMMPAGQRCIDLAKQNGSWSMLDEVEALVIPPDLNKAFDEHAGSKTFFKSLGKSVQKQMLQWLVYAKRRETRQSRITKIVEAAANGERLKLY